MVQQQQKQKKQQQPLKNLKKTLEERLARNLVNGSNGPIRINHYNPWTQQKIREGIGKEDPVSFLLAVNLWTPEKTTTQQWERTHQFIGLTGELWLLDSDWNWSQNSADGRAPINQTFMIITGSLTGLWVWPFVFCPPFCCCLITDRNKSVPFDRSAEE